MAGTASNVGLWQDADVYVTTDLAAPEPADTSTPFSAAWNLVGLLDGGAGFQESRDEDENDQFAWGGILVATTRKNFKLTKKFTALEDNATTRSLIWPGSTTTNLVVPKRADIKIAFETRTGGKVRRLISASRAQVGVDGDITDNEDDMSKVTFEATIFPDSGGVLWHRQSVPAIVSLALTPLTLALSLAGAAIKTLVATATYADATTGVVTASAAWFSTVPAKATVSAGYVTAVATGTTNVSATYGGITSTAPSVVTVSA